MPNKKPPKPPRPPDLMEFDDSPSGHHVWIDNELYPVEDPETVELVRVRRKRRLRDALGFEVEDDPTPLTPVSPRTLEREKSAEDQTAEVVVGKTVIGVLRSPVAKWVIAAVCSFFTGTVGGGIMATTTDDTHAQVEALSAALAKSNAETTTLRAEYAAHMEAHARAAYQVEQLAAQVHELIALENELHPRQR